MRRRSQVDSQSLVREDCECQWWVWSIPLLGSEEMYCEKISIPVRQYDITTDNTDLILRETSATL
jgi:hypothetical protein